MKTINQILLLVFVGCLLVGCYYDDTEIKQAIDENKAIQDSINLKSLTEQREALIATGQALQELRNSIYTYLSDTLQVDFDNQIDSLQAQIDKLVDADDSIRTWVENTFATLEQYEDLSNLLEDTKLELLDSIAAMADSLRAEIDEKYGEVLSNMQESLENISSQINTLEEKYSKEFDEIKEDIEDIKQRLGEIESKIEELEGRIGALEDEMDKLLSQIQSVTYLPQYADGLVKVSMVQVSEDDEPKYEYRCDKIEFLVRPEECVEALEQSMLSIKSISPQVRRAAGINANISEEFEIEGFVKGEGAQGGIIQITLKDNDALRDLYESRGSVMLALYIDNEATKTHVSSGFVVTLCRLNDELLSNL